MKFKEINGIRYRLVFNSKSNKGKEIRHYYNASDAEIITKEKK